MSDDSVSTQVPNRILHVLVYTQLKEQGPPIHLVDDIICDNIILVENSDTSPNDDDTFVSIKVGILS